MQQKRTFFVEFSSEKDIWTQTEDFTETRLTDEAFFIILTFRNRS